MSLPFWHIDTKLELLSASISSFIFMLIICRIESTKKEPIAVISLPIERSKIVLARYVSIFIFASVSTLLYLISSTLTNFLDVVTKLRPFTIEMLFFTLVDIIIFVSIFFPFYFRNSKSIGFFLIMFSLWSCLFAYFLSGSKSNQINSEFSVYRYFGISSFSNFKLSGGRFSINIYLFLLLMLTSSYFVSVWFYKRREFR